MPVLCASSVANVGVSASSDAFTFVAVSPVDFIASPKTGNFFDNASNAAWSSGFAAPRDNSLIAFSPEIAPSLAFSIPNASLVISSFALPVAPPNEAAAVEMPLIFAGDSANWSPSFRANCVVDSNCASSSFPLNPACRKASSILSPISSASRAASNTPEIALVTALNPTCAIAKPPPAINPPAKVESPPLVFFAVSFTFFTSFSSFFMPCSASLTSAFSAFICALISAAAGLPPCPACVSLPSSERNSLTFVFAASMLLVSAFTVIGFFAASVTPATESLAAFIAETNPSIAAFIFTDSSICFPWY